MLRNWKQLCFWSSPLKLGHFNPTASYKEIVRHTQNLRRQTFVSFRCRSSNLQIEKFRSSLTPRRDTRRCVHQSVNPNDSTDISAEKSTNVKSKTVGDLNPDWTVQERLIRTCIGLWEDYPHGSDFVVSYIDTASKIPKIERSRMPTVLSVARDLAHSESLRPLLESLARSGFRIIMPHLVGSELTRGLTLSDEERFSQMLGERSTLLLDFIGSTGIQRFDVVLGHCLECFPILTLASSFPIFDSVVLICPIPGHVSPRWIHPLNISLKMIDWFRSSIFWPFAKLYFHTYVRRRVSADRNVTTKQLHSCVEISHGVNYLTVSGFATMFESRRIPILYVYCDADPMVNSKHSEEFAEIFGITFDMTDTYNAEGQLVEKAMRTSARFAKAVRFSSQTHFPHSEQQLREVILKELIELYNDTLAKKKKAAS